MKVRAQKESNNRIWYVVLFSVFMMGILFFGQTKEAVAAQKDVSLGLNIDENVSINLGDTGTLSLNTTDEASYFYTWKDTLSRVTYESYNTDYFSLEEDGSYKALAAQNVMVHIIGYDANGVELFGRTLYIAIVPDMSKVSLAKSTVKGYRYDNTLYGISLKVALKGVAGMSDNHDNISFSYTSTNRNMSVSCDLENSTIDVSTWDTGSTVVNFIINGKEFNLKVTVKKVKLSGSNELLLTLKQKKTLKIKGISKKATWKSGNSKVVSVSKKGVLKAKKQGNAIITATIGSGKIACVVSVVTKARKKVINKALKIAKTCKYSQAKRMQKKYYDCSSLVWKSYRLEKKYFGMKNYAPVAANIGKWCVQHKKKIKGSNLKNLQKMKMKPGALMFETSNAKNGRYKGIYHVEMFIGYSYEGFSIDGKVLFGTKWANRPNNYYGVGDLWAQP